MHRHFCGPDRLQRPRVTLPRQEARHLITVLRLQEGDRVELFDGAGARAPFRIAQQQRHDVTLERLSPPLQTSPSPCRLTLCACVSKGKRMDWTIEKAVEIGVSRIIPAIGDRSVVRFADPAAIEERRERWLRVAIDAARQCGADWLPEIVAPLPLEEAIPRLKKPLLVAALSSDARPLRDLLVPWQAPPPPPAATWLVGPEGDFSPRELDLLRRAEGLFASLGRNILRTETAAVYGLAVLNAAWNVSPWK